MPSRSRARHAGRPRGSSIPTAGSAAGATPRVRRRRPAWPRARSPGPLGGGGALFSGPRAGGLLGRKGARLSDVNADLINCYVVVRDQVEPLVRLLQQHRNDEVYYYAVRALDPKQLDPVERAARLIYLNKTCFNGLFRENRHGIFNVPFGHYASPRFCDPGSLRAASAALQGVTIEQSSFEAAAQKCRRGDFVYFDPPYAPLSRTSSFVGYSAGGFGELQQTSLALCAAALAERGVDVLLSNSAAPLVQKLYGGFQVEEVQVGRAINSRGDRRGKISELLLSAGPHVGIPARYSITPGSTPGGQVAPQGLEPRTLRV